jgi:hypothetical protein
MTLAATLDSIPAERAPLRSIGLVTIASGLAAFGLLAFHPGGAATDFAGVLKEEAANRLADAAVHGGFIAVLAVQLVGYAAFARRLGLGRGAVIAGLVFFAAGAMFLSGSMLADGLMTPAIAARYVAHPDKIESARVLFVLLGTAIAFLMPIGLMFQGAGIAVWGWALAADGKRVAGAFGMILGVVLVAALGTALLAMNPMAMMAGIVATALWAMLMGAMMLRG